MFYRQELSFLCEIFQKSRITSRVIEKAELIGLLHRGAERDPFFLPGISEEEIPRLSPRTLYHLTDSLSLSYRLLCLPQAEGEPLLILGPYLSSPLSPTQILELGEKNGITPQKQGYFAKYYESIPSVPDDSVLWTMLHTFCERVWKTHAFSIRDISDILRPQELSPREPQLSSSATDTLLNMKAMERRYAFENEMIHAVERGSTYIEKQLMSAFSSNAFEKRLADPLRNTKNYCIIMNTLLRKAAERGGVHPMYLDRLSSAFAAKIEALSAPEKSAALMSEMFRSYCHLVREHSVKDFPPIVQKTILLIDADLASPLSPGTLARQQGISPGYLSTIFKRATGQTVSEFVSSRRMKHAAYLLETTQLQIQTVALHCGILDVQYFSKIFKSHFKCTPTQYRLAHRKQDRTQNRETI